MGQPIDRFPRPPYDPEIEPVVRAAAEAAAADNSDLSFLESLDIAKLRKEALERERPRTEALLRDERVTCRDLTIPGVRDGSTLTLTVVRPAAAARGEGEATNGAVRNHHNNNISCNGNSNGNGNCNGKKNYSCNGEQKQQPPPCIFYIHGGAMVRSNRYAGLDMSVLWATELGAVTVSVEYGLAPENAGTGPAEECYAALRWAAGPEGAAALAVDPDRIVLYGVSAGGGLAAAVALMARDRAGPPLRGLFLKAPMLDDRNPRSVAGQQYATGPMYNSTINRMAWRCLLGDRAGTAPTSPSSSAPTTNGNTHENQNDKGEISVYKNGNGTTTTKTVSPYEAPGRATDLAGLPATYLDCGTADPFRDDAAAFAARLWEGGVAAEFHAWPGCPHAFDRVAPDAAVSVIAVATRLAWLRRTLGVPSPPTMTSGGATIGVGAGNGVGNVANGKPLRSENGCVRVQQGPVVGEQTVE